MLQSVFGPFYHDSKNNAQINRFNLGIVKRNKKNILTIKVVFFFFGGGGVGGGGDWLIFSMHL